MSEEDLQSKVRQYIQDAIQFIDDEISPIRAKATRQYLGEPYGNEVDGRSQVVSRDIRDSVAACLPSLMRVFFGSEKVCEFVPRSAEDVDAAEQATDYVNYVIREDQPNVVGLFYSVFKDALMNRGGIVKWWYDDSIDVQTHTFDGLDEGQLALLLQEEGVEAVSVEPQPAPGVTQEQAAQMEAQGMPVPQIYNVELRRERKRNKVKIETMPPEEFFVDASATSMDNARVVGHRTLATVSSLVALGYDKDELDEHLTDQTVFNDNDEYWARHEDTSAETYDVTQKRVLYIEAWCKVDYDGDGIAELRRICTIGDAMEVVNNEPASDIPFAVFQTDPEPHVFFGGDTASLTEDLQKIKSMVLRGMLDSLSFALYPRTGVVEGMVDLDDVLNPEVGSVIRMRQPGMVQQLDVPFLGRDAFPMVEYLDSMKEDRTGMTAASQGLDPDVLQSTTRAAVNATVRGAEQNLELKARLLAETGFKPMFKGLLRLIVQHQDRERMVRLRNNWVPVDPRLWDSSMDVSINAGLGSGQTDEKLAVLQDIVARQTEAVQQLGMDNPICGLPEIRNTLGKMLELSGFVDTEQFFKPLPPGWQPPPPEDEGPTPEEQLLQLQQMDIQVKADIAKAKLEAEVMKQRALDSRERMRIEGDLALREFDLEEKYQNKVDIEVLKAALAEEREREEAG